MKLKEPSSLLTAGEEIALARRVHGPNPADALAARNELVLRNLGLVGKAVAWHRRKSDSDYDDLFSEGLLGLISAAELFDPARHNRFSTYASQAIFHTLKNYVMESGFPVRVPNYLHDPVQIAAKLAAPVLRRKVRANLLLNIQRASQAAGPSVSLSQPLHAEDQLSAVADRQPLPLDALIAREDTALVVAALAELPPLRAYILVSRRGLCGLDVHTLNSLGREIGFTKERIRQIEAEARDMLTAALARLRLRH